MGRLVAVCVVIALTSLACRETVHADRAPDRRSARSSGESGQGGEGKLEDKPIELSAAEPMPTEGAVFLLTEFPRLLAVELAAGDYFELTAEQHGIDVRLTVLGPDGSSKLTIDSPNGPGGSETAAVVATASARYGVMISPLSDQQTGEVRLRTITRRPAREADRRFVDVLARYAETPARDNAEERQQLFAERRQQLALLDDLDRPLLRSRLERALGVLSLQEGRVRQALQHFVRALPAVRDYSSAWELTGLLNDTGYAARLSGEPERARTAFEESLRHADLVSYDAAAATALNNLGVLSESLGDFEEALRFYDFAVGRWRRLNNLRSLATTLHNTGLTYISLGRFDQARDFFRQALDLRRQTSDRHGEAKTLTAVGWTSSLEGDHQCALDLYDQALVLRRILGDRRGEATTLEQRANALQALGRPKEALADFEEALRLLQASGNRISKAHVLTSLGEVLLEMKRAPEARVRHLEALSLFRIVGDHQGEVRALIGLAAVELRRGSSLEARQYHERALELLESIRGRLQSSAFRTSYVAAHYDAYSSYVDLLLELVAVEPTARHAADAYEALERARTRSLREGIGTPRTWWHRATTELRAEEKRLRDRINLLEDRRLSLIEVGATGAELEAHADEIEMLVREYEKLEGRLRQSAGPQFAPPRALTLEEVQAALDPGTTLLAYHLGEHEAVWLVERDRFLMRRLMDETRAPGALPHPISTERLAVRTRAALARSAGIGQLSQANAETIVLAERALGPVIEELHHRVVVAADGALATVPFGVLLPEHEVIHLPSASVLPLLRREREAPIGLLAMVADPIFSTEDSRWIDAINSGAEASPMTQDEATASEAWIHGLVADDLEIGLFQRLPNAGAEADAILSLVKEHTADQSQWLKRVGAEASRDLVMSGKLGGFRIVHFATHGWIDDRHPTLSGLVLSRFDESGRPRRGFLRIHEIERLELAADLVVLSACHTALGGTVRGEGVVGMAHAFFRAGARSLLVSYWQVDDRATAALMERFYQHLLRDGLPPAAALVAAQHWMRNETQWQEPYYWGAFALQGDWQ